MRKKVVWAFRASVYRELVAGRWSVPLRSLRRSRQERASQLDLAARKRSVAGECLEVKCRYSLARWRARFNCARDGLTFLV